MKILITVQEAPGMTVRRGLEVAAIVACTAFITFSARMAAEQPVAPPAHGADLKSIARQSLAKLDGDFNVAGLREPVEIIRDKWGVTHIYAKNEVDLFFAQGYVAAQDRLWQLYMWRMEHEGRLAEILGPPHSSAIVRRGSSCSEARSTTRNGPATTHTAKLYLRLSPMV
jgi:acyl-homoserine lactone acylase PvdQ